MTTKESDVVNLKHPLSSSFVLKSGYNEDIKDTIHTCGINGDIADTIRPKVMTWYVHFQML